MGTEHLITFALGIGPTYSKAAAVREDRYMCLVSILLTPLQREGVRLVDVFNPELFEEKCRKLADGYRKRFGDLFEYDIEEELTRFKEYRPMLEKYAVDGVTFMQSAQEKNMNIIVEGANALMLDVNYGSYPFVTSSNTTLGGIITGLTLNPKNITETIGVVKAYTTRVGQGAFKTEDLEEVGTKLQEVGREWGTSTGRRRRCGWLDLVVVKYSASINYYSALNLTKLDVLDDFDTIKVAIAYKVDGEELSHYPADLDLLARAEVVYHEMPGWKKPTTNARTFYDLPKQARDYVEVGYLPVSRYPVLIVFPVHREVCWSQGRLNLRYSC